ncbi:hypothetical protein A9Q97_05510 [Rhodospirillales bacterium 47_12_T64]|nr:hypothetical protein A9Q97_05510 [Rhodospirillales bacterium 47_12_T64]
MNNLDNSIEKVSFEDISNRKILVVDDAQSLLDLIACILKKVGFTNIHLVKNGQEAMEIITSWAPDLIILDLMMPVMDGMEVCRQVRSSEKTASIPIIVQTGMDDNKERLKAFESGASDLITKPINALELVARTKLHLHNLLLTEEKLSYQQEINDELAMAKEVQKNLLPSPCSLVKIRKQTKLNISSFFQPSSALGGDFWGAKTLSNDCIGFYITDFSGHGVVSALNTIRLHTLMFDVDDQWLEPSVLLTNLNQKLCDMLPTGQFATMILGVISPEDKQMHYAASAAPAPILGSWSNLSKYEYLDTTGLPLGINKSATYKTHQIPFDKENFLLCFSDALIETKMTTGETLEDEGLIKLLKNLATQKANPDLLDQVIATFFENSGNNLRDDLTALCFDYL